MNFNCKWPEILKKRKCTVAMSLFFTYNLSWSWKKQQHLKIPFISKSCCFYQLKILNQDAAALEGIWQFMLGVFDLGQVRNVTWIWSWVLQKMKLRFSKMIRGLWKKWQILRDSIVSCFHLWWGPVLSRDVNLTEDPDSKCEYSWLWRIFSEYWYILRVKLDTSRILFKCYNYLATY